jgi:biotin carboxyl carrier protein
MGVLCDETDIAELSVRLGSFELSVRRSLKPGSGAGSGGGGTAAAAADPAAPAIPTPPAATAFASTASMDGAAAPATATATASASLDEDDEESTLLLGAPKVGLLRRGRYVKGKRVGKGALVAEGDTVKKGQVLGFIEQLGTFVAIEAPQAGEIVEFLADEGDPVEYGEPVVSIGKLKGFECFWFFGVFWMERKRGGGLVLRRTASFFFLLFSSHPPSPSPHSKHKQRPSSAATSSATASTREDLFSFTVSRTRGEREAVRFFACSPLPGGEKVMSSGRESGERG